SARRARAGTGKGTEVNVSLFDALGEWMGAPMYYAAYGGSEPARSGADHASIAPYGPFGCDGDAWVYLGIQNAREWTRFCAGVLGQPELATDERFRTNPDRVAHLPALHAAIDDGIARLPIDEAIDRLDTTGPAL